MIAGPTSFYIEPSRLAASSFFWSKPPYTTIVGDHEARRPRRPAQRRARQPTSASELGRQLGDYLDEQLYGLPMILVSSLVATGPNVASLGFIKGNPYAGPPSGCIAK